MGTFRGQMLDSDRLELRYHTLLKAHEPSTERTGGLVRATIPSEKAPVDRDRALKYFDYRPYGDLARRTGQRESSPRTPEGGHDARSSQLLEDLVEKSLRDILLSDERTD